MLMNARLWRDEHGLHLIPWRPLVTAVSKHIWLKPHGGMFSVQESEVITLTNAWIASSNEHNLVWEVTSLKDVQCGCIPIIAFWFYDNIFDCKGLPWVKICAPLVDVAKNDRANMIYAGKNYHRFTGLTIALENIILTQHKWSGLPHQSPAPSHMVNLKKIMD